MEIDEKRTLIASGINMVVQKVLKIKDFNILSYKDANDVPGWDSMSHVIILTEIEKHFQVSISVLDLQAISDFDALINVVEGYLQ